MPIRTRRGSLPATGLLLAHVLGACGQDSPSAPTSASANTGRVSPVQPGSVSALALTETSYEAENATLASASIFDCSSGCSGGKRVGAFGNGNTLTFNVEAAISGTHTLTVYYTNGSNKNLTAQVRVNSGGSTALPSLTPTGSFEKVGGVSINVTLKAGGNTVLLENPGAYSADIDRIVITGESSGNNTDGSTGGGGLLGEYYDHQDFTGAKVTRTDGTVDFNWESGSPDARIGVDTFSARWTGEVRIDTAGEYTFFTNSDDGIRLFVDGKTVIDNWSNHAPTENNGEVTLSAGRHALKLEYYESGEGAVAQLLWQGPGIAKAILPKTNLYPAAGSTTPTDPPPTTSTGKVLLPVEVMGTNGTVVSTRVSAPSGASAKTLWMQINNLGYEGKASVKVNDCAWVTLNNNTVNFEGLASYYGGFNQVINTVKLTVDASGCGVNGDNTIQFRFDKTDNIASGYRVLRFNLKNNGTNLIADSSFQEDDPNNTSSDNWKVLRPSEVAAGEQLWNNAKLVQYPGGPQSAASCSGCHGHGNDMTDFNQSNHSIIQRSLFHGLTKTQGEQIASYLRARKPGGRPGRMWNPPFQPGMGMDTVAHQDFYAGAGLDQVYEEGGEALRNVPGGLNPQNLSAARGDYPRFKEIPVEIQLLDWNHHLPMVHPRDAFSGFAGSATETLLAKMESEAKTRGEAYVTSGDLERDTNALSDAGGTPIENATPACDAAQRDYGHPKDFSCILDKQGQVNMYSFLLYKWARYFDIVREYSLEQYMPEANAYLGKKGKHGNQFEAAYDPTTDVEPRSFLTGSNRFLFALGAHLNRIGGGDGEHALFVGGSSVNNNRALWRYQTAAWYHTQIIANSGSRRFGSGGAAPIDWQYSWFYVYESAKNGYGIKAHPEPALALATLIAATWNGNNSYGVKGTYVDANGFSFRGANPAKMIDTAQWDGIPADLRAQAISAGLEAWLNVAESFPISDWYRDNDCGDNGVLNSSTVDCENGHANWAYGNIPKARNYGVSNALVNRWASLMQKLFPNKNFNQFIQ